MAETLTTLRDRVELMLRDSSNDKWSTGQVDEAIRQALRIYSERLPYKSIQTVTLSADGREVDISSLTYRTVERVWWDYDSSDPDYPPYYRQFELWAGDIVFIKDSEEPESGDVVRLWTSADQTLSGLDSATATTFPENHTQIIAWGAAGFAVLSRVVEVAELSNLNKWVERNLREWGESQVMKFYGELDRLVAREATLHSGIAPARTLDRYDIGYSEW